MASNFKKITYGIVVLLLLLACYSVCYSQQVSKIVNYHAEYKPFGDGIQKEYPFPKNVDSEKHFQIVFTFDLTPEQIEANVMGIVTFDQENGTIQIRGTDGNLQSKGGLTLKGVVKIAFVIESIPFVYYPPSLLIATFTINQLVEFPLPVKGEATFLEAGGLNLSKLVPIGSLIINSAQTWNEAEPFSTLLLDDDVAVTGGIRKLVRAELTAVDVARLIVAALTAIPPSVSKPLGTIIDWGIGNAAISANLGFLSTATLSGESITVNGTKITSEGQTIEAPGLDLSQNAYTVHSSYNEKFTYKLDLIASSDVTIEFNPLGIPIWNYEKVIGEKPISPIVSEREVDLDFTPNKITFPIAQTSKGPTVQPPVPKSVIPEEVFTDGGSSREVDVAPYFSSENNLRYEVRETPSGIVTASVSGSRVTISPVAAGVATVRVTARDTVTNLTAIQTITVVVKQTSGVIVRPNPHETFSPPSSSNPRAEGLREEVSVITQNLDVPLRVREGPGRNYGIEELIGNGLTGIIKDGPRDVYDADHDHTYRWWKIEWDSVNLEGWSVEADRHGEQILFRRPPDLEILSFDVSPSTVGTGEEIELEVEIQNNGPGKSAATNVIFYYSENRDDDLDEFLEDKDRRDAGTLSVPSLRDGRSSRTLTKTVDVPRTPGRYYYGAILRSNVHDTDYIKDLTRDYLENDLARGERVDVISPDYIVESISVSRTTLDPGQRFTLRATVRNQGLGEPTSSADLDYYRSSNARISTSDTRIGDDRVSSLDTDETGRESISLTAPSEPGVYYYGACVSDLPQESNTNNNCSAAVAITVRAPDPDAPPAVPDLIIESPTASPSTIGPGESFILNVTVRNKGTATSPATTLRWYHSPNSNISVNDTEIGSANVGSLRAGRTDRQQINLTAPMTAGTYYYGGCVESLTNESDTANNCSSAIEITVENRAPTAVGTISGQTLSVEDTPMRLDVSPYFSDPNNALLTYTASSSDTSVVEAEAVGVLGSNLAIRPIAEGSVTITVTANDGELTATQVFSVTVNPIPVSESPDLVVSLTATENLVDPNGYFELQATVRNQGNTDTSDGITLRYFISSDPIISTDDVEINMDSIGNLKSGFSKDEDYGLRASQKPGVYYYYACVDSVTGEENTDNNCSSILAVAVRGPDLIVESVLVDLLGQTGGINPNGNFKLNVTVKNQGTGAAESTILRFYVSSDNVFSSGDTEVETTTLNSLGIGNSSNELSNTIQSSYISGVFYCFVCVDSLADEVNTANNCSVPIEITVRNVAPAATGTIPAQTLNVGTPMPLDVSAYFTDANNDTLTYTAISNNTTIATASVSGVQVTIVPKSVGPATITVTANDGALTATQIITATVFVGEETWMPDAHLRASVRTALGLNQGEALTQKGMSELTTLVSSNTNMQNLTGLEYATELRHLLLYGTNQIRDIGPLKNLTALKNLRIRTEHLSDITPLQNLTVLTELVLNNNQISDITPLQNLTALTNLRIHNNQISDITPLKNLTALTELVLNNNQISDITPLKDLTALTFLGLQNNQISDVSSLEGLTALRTLYLSGNPIADHAPLRELKTKNPNLSTDITIPAGPTNRAPIAVGLLPDKQFTVGDSSVVLDVSGNFSDPDNDTLTYTASSNNTAVATASVSSTQVTITPIGPGNATVTVTASDGSLTATQTIAATVAAATGTNRAPVAVGLLPDKQFTVGDSSVVLDVSGNFSDPDNDTLTYTVSSNNTAVATASVSNAQVTITPVGAGNATITVTASDGSLTATQTIAATVSTAPTTNRAPTTVGTIPNQALRVGNSSVVLDVSGNFSDPDNDTLTYTASSSNTAVATASMSNSQVTITPIGLGSATITVTADDGSLTATQTIAATVSTAPVTNRAPTTIGTISAQTLTVGGAAVTIDVSGNFSDADNNTLVYTATSSNTSIATVSSSNSQVTIAPVAVGNATITVTANDGSLTATQTIAVSVNPTSNIFPVCNRTAVIRNAILAKIPGVNDCANVTEAQLTSITGDLRLPTGFGTTKVGDFDGLKNLENLHLSQAQLTSLEANIFSGLTNLTGLHLETNQLATLDPNLFSSLTNLRWLILGFNPLTSVDANLFSSLTNLTELQLRGTNITSLPTGLFFGLNDLQTLLLDANQLTSLPAGVFEGLSNLTHLRLEDNPGSPFTLTLKLARTDTTDLTDSGPATVKVRVAEGAPFEMHVDLSVTNGTLSSTTATIPKGSTESSAITVTQSGAAATTVTLGPAPRVPASGYRGIQTDVGASLVLFGNMNSPVAVGRIPNQTLAAGSSAVTVDVSGNFSDPDNDTLTYTASSSNTAIATASVSSSQITITPVAAGSATITVTANDGSLTATQTISVLVVSSTEETWMPDANLRAAVRSALKLRTDEALTQQKMTELTLLIAESAQAASLTGLEYATKLEALNLSNGSISDITPLSGLTALRQLFLNSNSISDITSLKGLTALTNLGLNNNPISDFTPLNGLTTLTGLDLSSNSISDITFLNRLTALTNLHLDSNSISDINPLKGLTALWNLSLSNNQISNITALSGLTTLWFLNLNSNSIGDINSVKGLTALRVLELRSNQISDITPLSGLTAVTNLTLANNQISDVSALENLVSLKYLTLSGNQITDKAPLRRLKEKNPSVSIDVSIPQNNSPVAVGTISAQTLTVGGSSVTVNVSGKFNDPDNDTLTYTARTSNSSFATVSVSTAQVTITPVAAGSATITVTVSDGSLTATQTISVTVTAAVTNRAPTAVGTIPNQTLTVGGAAVTIDVSSKFSDADNDTLTYTASSSSTTVADVSRSGSTITITPKIAGSVTVTVTASDGSLTATLEFEVDVLSSIILDENLAVVVRQALGLGVNDDITYVNILGLTSLRAARHSASPGAITDLTGLENATNLTTLNLSRNAISDLSPLAALTNLTSLTLRDNDISISDISALKTLTNLTSLDLLVNDISDVTPLKNLTKLTFLLLGSNDISDVTPLKNLTKLTTLNLYDNDISDISPLAALTNLTSLNLAYTGISDVTPLKNLTKLTRAYLHNNDISDVTPLKGLTNLTNFLDLHDNDISDVTPLKGLTNLKSLILSNNQINDVSPLASLTNLTSLSLNSNTISDISSLKALTKLIGLTVSNNQIADLPVGMFKNFSRLTTLWLDGNPGAPFTLTLELARTDNTNLSAASPATVKVKLSEGAPFAMSVSLSVTNGTLSTTTATIAKGGTESSAITVTQTGNGATTVSLGTAPSIPSSNYKGIQTAVGNSLVLFSVDAAPTADGAELPNTTALLPNYPNPFNPETWIPYQLSKPADVTLTIYNVRGVMVRQLALGHRAAGVYYSRTRAAHWDGKNNLGEKVAAGLYFCTLKAGDFTATRRMLIRK